MRRSTRKSTVGVSLDSSLDNDALSGISTHTSSSIPPPPEHQPRTTVGSGSFSTKFSMTSFVNKIEELTDEQRSAIRSIGFGNLLLLPSYTLRKNLILEWKERWDIAEKAFLLLNQKVTITPMDVALILGLRATGKPVSLDAETQFCDLEAEYGATIHNRMITVSAIEERLQSLGGSADEDFIRTFLLFTFGTLLFPNNGKLDSRYISLLQDLQKVSEYAWGVAVVDDLFNWLTLWKQEQVKSIGGCLILLQVWSYEHIDIGRPNLVSGSLSFPRACRWEGGRSTFTRQWVTTKFDELEKDQVVWQLQPSSSELDFNIINELLVAENGNEGQQLSKTTATTKRTSNQCVGLPPKSSSQLASQDEKKVPGVRLDEHAVTKKGVLGDGKHGTKSDSPEKSMISTDGSVITVDLPECSSSFYAQEGQSDRVPETSHILKEDYRALLNENSNLKKENFELTREIDILRRQLSFKSKSEEDLRKEVEALNEELECSRLSAAVNDQLQDLFNEYFDGVQDCLT